MTVAAPPTRELRYRLRPVQRAIFNDPARFRVVVAGRRGGKSYLSCFELLRMAINTPESVSWYVAPTYQQGRMILWKQLKKLTPPSYLLGKPNDSDLSIRFLNGSVIAIKGADNPDSLRGSGLDLVIFDEFAFQKPAIWYEVITPMLADTMGRALFVTTPNGLNWAYDLYLKGLKDEPGWKSWTYTTLEGGNVEQQEIERLRGSMTERLFRQELEASFETMAGRVYDNFVRADHIDPNVVDVPSQEILVGQDFNVNPMATVIGVRAGDALHILDALEIPTSNTEEVATELRRRYPQRAIIVCPDPSGNSRRTSASVGVTDFTILRRQGIIVDAAHAAPPVTDRINAVQTLLRDAVGQVRFKVHPRAMPLIRALDGQIYKPGTNIPDKSSGLDHMADAVGYLIWQRFNRLQSRHAILLHVNA